MPELPDINAYLLALKERLQGQKLLRLRLGSPFVLRTAEPPAQALSGLAVVGLSRLGKRVVLEFESQLFAVIHLMIAGRLHWKGPDAKLSNRNQLAAFDFEAGTLLLTEAGTKRRASIHIVNGSSALEALNPGGMEVSGASFEAFQAALMAENRTLKRALTDPRILSGIGNAYSDEILHAAKLSPIAQTHKLDADEWLRLFEATRDTLDLWTSRLAAEAERQLPEKVTAFRPDMAAHGRFGKPCPRCGDPIQRIRYADNETNYCARCQTGGKLLADRGLSRLLGKDWPRTLDELEALKRR